MSRLVDLSMPVPARENDRATVRLDEWPINMGNTAYTGMVYHFRHWSMSGTYIDLPGHIKETDDGLRTDGYPLEKLFRVPAAVIHLDREERPGKVRASELEAGCADKTAGGGLVIHALGSKPATDMTPSSTVSLAADAVQWIADRGVHLLISDVYENKEAPENVFPDLFKAGIATVCHPVNLAGLDRERLLITILFPRFPEATQVPCRAVAELD